MGAEALLADAREALRELTGAARERGLAADDEYVAQAAARRAEWLSKLRQDVFAAGDDDTLTQAQMLGIINAEAREGDTVVAAAGSPPSDLLKMWDCSGGRNAHIEFGYSCMGYEIPASLGVRLAQPEGEVYTFVGDGTYLMNPTELVTAVQEGLKITVTLSRNHGFQCIRDLQLRAAGHHFGNEFRRRDPHSDRLEGDLVEVDFAATARAFGARAWNATTASGLREALAQAREETRPCVIVVDTDPYERAPGSDAWWDVAPAEVTDDAVTAGRRAGYERERAVQRHYG
jgi:3D-(3,5/4)-trihydroxycyclohexane-1,2-dione acylhydrolase (decyclizing)